MGTKKMIRELTQAVIAEGHSVVRITQKTNGHQRAVCRDNRGREFNVVTGTSPGTEQSVAIYRIYVRRAYRHFERDLADAVDPRMITRLHAMACKTPEQRAFEEQWGKSQREQRLYG